MSEDLSTALVLLGVGMITVFIVLSFVVLVGNLLILFVNKYVPSEVSDISVTDDARDIEPSGIAAITAAVNVFTKGKGRVVTIKKSNR